MRLLLNFLILIAPSAALAKVFERPIPKPETAQAELSYFIASIVMLCALVGVQWLISRR